MPELPEVETLRSALDPLVTGRCVIDAWAHRSAKFTPATAAVDATILGARRRGKFLLLPLDDGRELVIHLGMTGRLSFGSAPVDDSDAYLRAWFRLAGTALRDEEILLFHDIRRFGRIRVVPAGDYATIPTLARAGPEPWDPALTPARFHHAITTSSRAIKTQLLSQRPVAGVGNIYADEALWAARINPKARRVGVDRARRLLGEIQTALQRGIDNGGTTLRDYRKIDGAEGANRPSLKAYGRAGEPCLRCGATLVSDVIDARTSVWCPVCQRR